MTTFNPQEYWEKRLEKSFDLHGVGDIGLGINYNNCLYKIRKFAFHQLMKSLKINFSEVKVMDIGSGTGFYIERWKELKVKLVQVLKLCQNIFKIHNCIFHNKLL